MIISHFVYHSQSAWLQEHENATLPRIRQRMEVVTGLVYVPETASEYFQVITLMAHKKFQLMTR